LTQITYICYVCYITNLTMITHMTEMTNKKNWEFRVRNIPDGLYKQFKIVSVLKGLTVNELFLKAMTEIVEKENEQTQGKNSMA